MTSDELRAEYLSFFEKKGHKIIPSSSLIPHGDPTLLLTTAGVVQIKPYFMGEATPPSLRLASCQKCFRTTDIESVGDATHLTFFEMLGNFSVGDYFKKEAITWGWEFVTKHMKMPQERLWITIFLNDDEAFKLWREIGVPEERIVRLGEKDNFWGPPGDSGPCGPCSEIHYDLGEEIGCDKPTCAPGCDCGRYVEFWNLVFTEYNQDKNGKRTPLPKPNIDTGMGLERAIILMQGKTSAYDTDIFTPLLKRLGELTGKKYGTDNSTDNSMRVVAEHGRAVTFLIADGVMPSNEGRGYVLRRLLRRASLFGKRLGLEKPFLAETAKTTIKQMKHVYPELEQRGDFILKVITQEETRFAETLNTGLELLDGIIKVAASKKSNIISGKDAFKLYDTYGFPVELTKEIAAERGFSVDLDGFKNEMEQQRERAKASQTFALAEKGGAENLDITETAFTGYSKLSKKTSLAGILVDKNSTNAVQKGQEASLVLHETPFYGEMGGQVGDTGEIRSAKGLFTVTNTVHLTPDIIVHQGQVSEGSFSTGDKVTAEVNKERRLDIQRNHTATHLLQAALRQVVGEHVQQRGSLVAPERFRFDFSHLVAMTREEIDRVQEFVNENIRQDLKVNDEQMPYKKAIEAGVTALFGEKYGETVRVLTIGKPAVSAELCGGTHAGTTGEIGFFHIVSESSVGAGLRRIEAVTGRGAEKYFNQRLADLEKVAVYLEVKPDEVVNQAQNLSTELKSERKRVQSLESQLSKKDAEAIEGKAREVGSIKVLAEQVSPTSVDNLRAMSDGLRINLGNSIVVLGTVWNDKPVFVANTTLPGYDASQIVRLAASATGGSGGGKKTLAQGGGVDISKIGEGLTIAFEYIKEQVRIKGE